MNQRDALKQVLQANNQLRQMLDAQIAEKRRLGFAIDTGYEVQPFFYTAVGNDDETGILIPGASITAASQLGVSNPFFGFIRMNDDAPFIATHIHYSFGYDTSDDDNNYVADGVQESIGFRIFDVGSGQQISIAQRGNTLNNEVLPGRILVQEQIVDVGGLQLSSEQEFSPGAVLRIEAYSEDFGTIEDYDSRVYFTLCGYKVFGG